jgi:DNA-binding transcriptional LysR family regulator
VARPPRSPPRTEKRASSRPAVDYDLLRAFSVAAAAPSFAAAATRLRVTPSAVSQQIAALEAQLGLPLFERFGRRVRLGEPGRRLLEALAGPLAEIDRVLAAEREARAEVAGLVRLGAPGPFARVWLRPRLVELLAAHPALVVDARFLVTSALARGLRAGDFDFCLLATEPEDAALESAVIFVEQFVAVASAAYLTRHGRPRTARDLRDHAWVVFDEDLAMLGPWWRSCFGRREDLPSRIVARVASLDEMLALAAAGAGITVLPNYFVAEALAAGQVVALPGGAHPASNPIHLAWRRSAPRTARFLAVKSALLAP